MKLRRPYIPLEIRIAVACRQLSLAEDYKMKLLASGRREGVLATLLRDLADHLECDVGDLQLDHNPALQNRKQIRHRGTLIDYDPPANDPDFLIYRDKAGHYIKTNVRGDGAQYSDRVLAKREKRRNRNRVVRKIPSRPFWRPNEKT